MDDNNSELEELRIDRQRGAMRPIYQRGFGWMPVSIQNALITASILGLAATMWTFKESLATNAQAIAVLATTQQFQQRQIDRMEVRQDSLEGHIVRGRPEDLRDSDAPHKQ